MFDQYKHVMHVSTMYGWMEIYRDWGFVLSITNLNC